MLFFDWLLNKSPKIEDPLPVEYQLPQTLKRASAPPPPTLDPSDMLSDEGSEEIEPLENLYCHLEYEDANHNLTRRPVTFLSLSRRFAVPSIIAVCHLRGALRTFRTDRIKCIITADGEVFEGQSFLTEIMDLDLIPTASTGDARPRVSAPQRRRGAGIGVSKTATSRDFRELILSPLTVLVACGKADGYFHREEVDRIMVWTEHEATYLFQEGLIESDLTLDEANALGKTISAMRPQQRTLRRHIEATLTLPPDRLARFRYCLCQIIRADGVINASEIDFMKEFDKAVLAAEERTAKGND